MSDILAELKRLSDRKTRHDSATGTYWNACEEGADEIERLRDLNETYKHDAHNQRDIVEQLKDEVRDDGIEIERLRRELQVERESSAGRSEVEANLRARVEELEEELYLHENPKHGEPMVMRHLTDSGVVWTLCVECGSNVKVDEDGCCVSCGRGAVHYGQCKDLDEADARVEELEGELTTKKFEAFDKSCEWFKDKYIVAAEQINAAWAKRVTDADGNEWINPQRLGIVRCEGCGGEGNVWGDWIPTSCQYERKPCPDCAKWGSHGWRIE